MSSHRQTGGPLTLPCPTSLSRSKRAVVQAGFVCRSCSLASRFGEQHIRKPNGHHHGGFNHVDGRGGCADALVVRRFGRNGHRFRCSALFEASHCMVEESNWSPCMAPSGCLVRRGLDRASALVLEAGRNRGFVSGLNLRGICLSRSRGRLVLANGNGCFGGLGIERFAACGQFHCVGPAGHAVAIELIRPGLAGRLAVYGPRRESQLIRRCAGNRRRQRGSLSRAYSAGEALRDSAKFCFGHATLISTLLPSGQVFI